MARLRCTLSDGLRPAEASVSVKDHEGTDQNFPLDRGALSRENGTDYVFVNLIQYNENGRLALVRLPAEADSGTQAIWAPSENLLKAEMAR